LIFKNIYLYRSYHSTDQWRREKWARGARVPVVYFRIIKYRLDLDGQVQPVDF